MDDNTIHLWVDYRWDGVHLTACGKEIPAVEDGDYTKRVTGLVKHVTCDKCLEEEE